jgi:hypothetical protein
MKPLLVLLALVFLAFGQTHMEVQTAVGQEYLDLASIVSMGFPASTFNVLGPAKSYPLYSVRKITFTTYTAGESRGPELETAFHGLLSNPFNPTAALRFDLGSAMRCRVCVYGHDGKKVAVLADGPRSAGGHTVVWDGKNSKGKPVSSGLYIFEVTLGKKTVLEKAVLLK